MECRGLWNVERQAIFEMRMVQHSGRGCRNARFNDKHNDRNYDVESAENIDVGRIEKNIYFGRKKKGTLCAYRACDIGKMGTFEEQERRFYRIMFSGQYERQMESYRARGQKCRVVDFDTWRDNKRYAPEEIIYQVGKVGDSPKDEEKLMDCYMDIMTFLGKSQEKLHYFILDAAIHCDEKDGVMHLHVRRVWNYTDADGVTCIGQEKALEQAGIELPKPDEPVGRYNNRKMTFDAMMRETMMSLVEKHGFTIEKMPEKGKKHNRSKAKYLADLGHEKLAEADARQAALDRREADLDERERVLKQAELANIQTFAKIGQLLSRASAAAQAELGPELAKLQRQLPDISSIEGQASGPDTGVTGPGE